MSWASGENGYHCVKCHALGPVHEAVQQHYSVLDPDNLPVNCIQHACPTCGHAVEAAFVCVECFADEPRDGMDICTDCWRESEDYDPTPWCSYHGSRENCDCLEHMDRMD